MHITVRIKRCGIVAKWSVVGVVLLSLCCINLHASTLIPDTIVTRWKIQPTAPLTIADLDSFSTDLKTPSNLIPSVEYNTTDDNYLIGTQLGEFYLSTPILLTNQEYYKYSEKKELSRFFREKDILNFQTQEKNKFDFTDMHFNIGPAEKIFGPGGVQVKTQGTAELKLGATINKQDDASLALNNRTTTAFNFDEKVNLNMQAKVGDKLNFNLNYNTDATFSYDANNLKLTFEGKDDDIVKLLEAGNTTLESNNPFINPLSSLFGIKTNLQFGKLTLQAVVAQKNSETQSMKSNSGSQTYEFTIDATDYDDNRHFFLSQYFYETYDKSMNSLPNINSQITITKVEIWVTNKTKSTTDTRNILSIVDLAEDNSNSIPQNNNNNLYQTLIQQTNIRDIQYTKSTLQNLALTDGNDFEIIQNARLLNESEYQINTKLGYISLNSKLNNDQILAIAYEYNYMGQTYKVGEFTSDLTSNTQTLITKTLKLQNNTPQKTTWNLMMKNIYNLNLYNIDTNNLTINVKYKNANNNYSNYINDENIKNIALLQLLNLDNINSKNQKISDNQFDIVEDYTIINNQCIAFTTTKPFTTTLKNSLQKYNSNTDYTINIYDTTKYQAQKLYKNKYVITGKAKGTKQNIIQLNSYNLKNNSVTVYANGQLLTENVDYNINYSSAELTILNQNIIDSNTPLDIQYDENTNDFTQKNIILGLNAQYDFNKNTSLSLSAQHLIEHNNNYLNKQYIDNTTNNNTLIGLNLNTTQKLPFLNDSQLNLKLYGATLIRQTQNNNKTYIDDFDNSRNEISLMEAKKWKIASQISNTFDNNNRTLFAWYSIDPLLNRSQTSDTPDNIRGNKKELSLPQTRPVPYNEIHPDAQYTTTTSNYITTFDIAYYPNDRGPYNQTLNKNNKWAGCMYYIESNDLENQKICYIKAKFTICNKSNNILHFDIGNISEDILPDNLISSEGNFNNNYIETNLAKINLNSTQYYGFDYSVDTENQDVGLDGYNDEEEKKLEIYTSILNASSSLNDSLRTAIENDPAGDDYIPFLSEFHDRNNHGIVERYKWINGSEGNSSSDRYNGVDVRYTSDVDTEDLSYDFTLNSNESYTSYALNLNNISNSKYIRSIEDKRVATTDGNYIDVQWCEILLPLNESSLDLSCVPYIRMWMEGEDESILRFSDLSLCGSVWEADSDNPKTSDYVIGVVGYEDDGNLEPVNYILPPGVELDRDASNGSIVLSQEYSLSLKIENLKSTESFFIERDYSCDLSLYENLSLYVSFHSLDENIPSDGSLYGVVRLCSGMDSYYEYSFPLICTPSGKYTGDFGRSIVWPNFVDIDLKELKELKLSGKSSAYSENSPSCEISIKGVPNLSDITRIELGARNVSGGTLNCELWFNELYASGVNDDIGTVSYAVGGELGLDFNIGNILVQGTYKSKGFGGLEDDINSNGSEYCLNYSMNFDLGKIFPSRYNISIPLYYSYGLNVMSPLYDPYLGDILVEDVNGIEGQERPYSVLTKERSSNFSLSNVVFGLGDGSKLWHLRNFSFSYGLSTLLYSDYSCLEDLDYDSFFSLGYGYHSRSKGYVHWIPDGIDFNLRWRRTYSRITNIEYDGEVMEEVEGSYSSLFEVERKFSLNWELIRGLNLSYSTNSVGDLEYGLNYNRDMYDVFSDSVMSNILSFGDPLSYVGQYGISYTLPFGDKVKYLNSITCDVSYNSNYKWDRGCILSNDEYTSHSTGNSSSFNLRGVLSIENLYKQLWPNEANKKEKSEKNKNEKSENEKETSDKENKSNRINIGQITLYKDSITGIKLPKGIKNLVCRDVNGNRVAVKWEKVGRDSAVVYGIGEQDSVVVEVEGRKKVKTNGLSIWQPIRSGLEIGSKAVLGSIVEASINWERGSSSSIGCLGVGIGDWFGQGRGNGGLFPGIGYALGMNNNLNYLQRQIERGNILCVDSITGSANFQKNEDISMNLKLGRGALSGELVWKRNEKSVLSVDIGGNGVSGEIRSGSMSMTCISIGRLVGLGDGSKFRKFCNSLEGIRNEVQAQYVGLVYPEGMTNAQGIDIGGSIYDSQNGSINELSSDVLIPAFLRSYCLGQGKSLDLLPSLKRVLPNWRITLSLEKYLKKKKSFLKSINIKHEYQSIFNLNSYTSNSTFKESASGLGFIVNTITQEIVPSKGLDINSVSIAESFSPLLGVETVFQNGISLSLEYRTSRVTTLNVTSYSVNEAVSNDWVLGAGYKISGFLQGKGKTSGKKGETETTNKNSKKGGVNRDLDLKLNVSYREQASVVNDIATMASDISSGNTAFALSFTASYTLSRLASLSFYYDQQTNTPLLSTSSYPTSVYDFGFSLKVSLTR